MATFPFFSHDLSDANTISLGLLLQLLHGTEEKIPSHWCFIFFITKHKRKSCVFLASSSNPLIISTFQHFYFIPLFLDLITNAKELCWGKFNKTRPGLWLELISVFLFEFPIAIQRPKLFNMTRYPGSCMIFWTLL